MKYIGAHVSISKGPENAPENAENIGAKAFAMFTRNQRRWTSKPLTDNNITQFKENCKKLGYDPKYILPHDGYLINLGHPEEEKLEMGVRPTMLRLSVGIEDHEDLIEDLEEGFKSL